MEEDEDVNDHPDRFVVDCTYVTFIITFMKLSSSFIFHHHPNKFVLDLVYFEYTSTCM